MLTLWLEADDLNALIELKGQYSLKPLVVERCMKKSAIARVMFASHWLSCSRQLFRIKLLAGMVDLEKEDFHEDHIEGFFERMEAGSLILKQAGHLRGSRQWTCDIPIFGKVATVKVDFPGDEWELVFWARVNTIAANTGQFQFPLVWERLLVPAGSVASEPTELQFPDHVLQSMENFRSTVAELIGTKRTLKDMVKAMTQNEVELTEGHKVFKVLLPFLQEHAATMLEEKVDLYCYR